MLLHESRRPARSTPEGDIVLLEDQDRSKWDARLIAEGQALVERALRTRRFGAYTVQAAIAAVHASAASAAATDWRQIAALYDALLAISPSPVVELNRAVAVAMRDGPAAGLELIDAILERSDLGAYHLAHAARADLLRRLGRRDGARRAYERALALAQQEPEAPVPPHATRGTLMAARAPRRERYAARTGRRRWSGSNAKNSERVSIRGRPVRLRGGARG